MKIASTMKQILQVLGELAHSEYQRIFVKRIKIRVGYRNVRVNIDSRQDRITLPLPKTSL